MQQSNQCNAVAARSGCQCKNGAKHGDLCTVHWKIESEGRHLVRVREPNAVTSVKVPAEKSARELQDEKNVDFCKKVTLIQDTFRAFRFGPHSDTGMQNIIDMWWELATGQDVPESEDGEKWYFDDDVYDKESSSDEESEGDI